MITAGFDPRKEYTGPGGDPHATPIFSVVADLVVTHVDASGVETALTLGADYAVVGGGAGTAGDLTLTVALLASERLIIVCDPTVEQPTDYVPGNAFPAETHETRLDKLTLMVARSRDLIDRCLRLPDTVEDPASSLTLPVSPANADKFIVINSAGDGIDVATGTESADVVHATGTPVDGQIAVWTSDDTIEGLSNLALASFNRHLKLYSGSNASTRIYLGKDDSDYGYISGQQDSGGDFSRLNIVTGSSSSSNTNAGSINFSVDGSQVMEVQDNGLEIDDDKILHWQLGDSFIGFTLSSRSLTIAADDDDEASSTVIALEVDGAQRVICSSGGLYPATDDGAVLGLTTNAWSDLRLASGSVIDWDSSDVTLTHAANQLTLAGGDLALPSFTLDSVTVSGIVTEAEGLASSDNDTSVPTTAAVIDYVTGTVGHAAVTLAGSYDYLSLSGQEITLGQIDLATDITGDLPFANLVAAGSAGFVGATGAGDYAHRTYAQVRADLDLEAGTDFYSISAADAAFQPLDSDLTSIAALTTTSYGRGLLELADAAALKAAADVDHLITLSGVSAAADDLGTFTGSTITDNVTVKAALQELETAVEAAGGHDAVTLAGTPDYLSLSGQEITLGQIDLATDITGDLPFANLVAAGSAGFIGATGAGDYAHRTYAQVRADLDLEAGTDFYSISAADAAFQPLDSDLTSIAALTTTSYGRGLLELADAAALKAAADVDHLITLSGVSAAADDLGTFTGTTINDNVTVKAALQALETAVEAAGGHDAVTLAGTPDYLSLSGQEITLGQIDLATDITGDLPFANLVAAGSAGFIGATGAGDYAHRTYAQVRADLDLEAGTDFYSISAADAAFQPLDSDLTSIAALTTTSYGRGLLELADAAALKAAADVDHLITLSGVSAAADDLGTFTGTTINDNVTVKAALQALETAVEAAGGHDAVTLAGTPDYLSLSGQEITLGQIDLATDITGDLPFANLVAAGSAGFIGATGAGDYAHRTYAEVRADLGLEIGTDVQAYDADLDTWAGLTPSANAQSLVTAANYAAMRGLLDLEAGTDFYSTGDVDDAVETATINAETGTHVDLGAQRPGAAGHVGARHRLHGHHPD